FGSPTWPNASSLNSDTSQEGPGGRASGGTPEGASRMDEGWSAAATQPAKARHRTAGNRIEALIPPPLSRCESEILVHSEPHVTRRLQNRRRAVEVVALGRGGGGVVPRINGERALLVEDVEHAQVERQVVIREGRGIIEVEVHLVRPRQVALLSGRGGLS